MKNITFLIILFFISLLPNMGVSQVDEDQMGAWYMYLVSTTFNDGPWGMKGSLQYRDWKIAGDLEQIVLRGGVTYQPQFGGINFTLGATNTTNGSYGDDDSKTRENRIYEEAAFPFRIGHRFYIKHRLRYEQRFIENQDFRTRYRYNFMLKIPINHTDMEENTIYLALYNEIFLNGQREIGDGNSVELFDRNRFYYALGYIMNNGLKIQLGAMNQTTDHWSKNQLQLSLNQSI